MISVLALFIFVVNIVVVDIVLIVDGLRWLLHKMTITEYVGKHPLWAIPLVGWIVIGAVALAVHLVQHMKTGN